MSIPEPVIRAIIADDEPLARNLIRNYLISFPQIKIVAECENGLKALNCINDLHPDLLFLDIQMPDIDGFSVLKELKQFPLIIFTTAFHQYAVEAFELNAVDYLLKPFDKERFAVAVQKALLQKSTPSFIQKQIDDIQRTLGELIRVERKFTSRILVKNKEIYSFLPVKDILWFEAFNDYVKIHTTEKFHLKNISLNELEAKLNPDQFVRIHRSSMVNIAYIKELKPYFNGEYHIFLTNGEKLKLSRSYKAKLRQIIDENL